MSQSIDYLLGSTYVTDSARAYNLVLILYYWIFHFNRIRYCGNFWALNDWISVKDTSKSKHDGLQEVMGHEPHGYRRVQTPGRWVNLFLFIGKYWYNFHTSECVSKMCFIMSVHLHVTIVISVWTSDSEVDLLNSYFRTQFIELRLTFLIHSLFIGQQNRKQASPSINWTIPISSIRIEKSSLKSKKWKFQQF